MVTGTIAHWDTGPASDRAELLLNTGDSEVKFKRPGNAVTGLDRKHPPEGWNEGLMSESVFDFDGDGWADIYWGDSDYEGTVGRLYHQDSPRHFSLVSTTDGIDMHHSSGSAVADFDHDGKLDIVVGSSLLRCDPGGDCNKTAQVRLYRNVFDGYGNYLALSLTGGPNTNRAAIGARVTVTAGTVTQTRAVGGGYGLYVAQDDLVQHVAVGAACDAVVTVRWPDAALTTETYKLPVGHRFAITQGEKPHALLP
ncbi:MAG: hypothetical protein NVS3B20_01610 [Polyangiales bacterium]